MLINRCAESTVVADVSALGEDAAFAKIKERWGGIDFLVHSIAFAGKEELQGSMVANTSREGFRRAMIFLSTPSLTHRGVLLKLCRAGKRAADQSFA